jgi:hypothetical protein
MSRCPEIPDTVGALNRARIGTSAPSTDRILLIRRVASRE